MCSKLSSLCGCPMLYKWEKKTTEVHQTHLPYQSKEASLYACQLGCLSIKKAPPFRVEFKQSILDMCFANNTDAFIWIWCFKTAQLTSIPLKISIWSAAHRLMLCTNSLISPDTEDKNIFEGNVEWRNSNFPSLWWGFTSHVLSIL